MKKLIVLLIGIFCTLACPVLDFGLETTLAFGGVYFCAFAGWWIFKDEIGWALACIFCSGLGMFVDFFQGDEKISTQLGIATFDCRGDYKSGKETIHISGKDKNKISILADGRAFQAKVQGSRILLDSKDTLYFTKIRYANPDTTEYENVMHGILIYGRLQGQNVNWEMTMHKVRYDPIPDSGLGG